MDTEAGGEGSQYESIPVTQPHSKQGGQMDVELQPDAVTSHQEQLRAERGEKTAENVRYGQAISEEGMEGKTTEAGGDANQGGFGAIDAQGATDDDSRQAQGYGSGSGIGA